jgi:hypothetical protein
VGEVGRGIGPPRGTLLQRRDDGQQHTLGVAKHLVVPEPQHGVALGAQGGVALAIDGVGMVLTAIDFDDQTRLGAEEIDDIRPDRRLAAEFDPELPLAQASPQQPFGVGQVAPQFAGALDGGSEHRVAG